MALGGGAWVVGGGGVMVNGGGILSRDGGSRIVLEYRPRPPYSYLVAFLGWRGGRRRCALPGGAASRQRRTAGHRTPRKITAQSLRGQLIKHDSASGSLIGRGVAWKKRTKDVASRRDCARLSRDCRIVGLSDCQSTLSWGRVTRLPRYHTDTTPTNSATYYVVRTGGWSSRWSSWSSWSRLITIHPDTEPRQTTGTMRSKSIARRVTAQGMYVMYSYFLFKLF